MTSAAPPVVIVGHGTRSAKGAAEFGRLIDRVWDRSRGRIPAVDGGFIELSEPPIGEVINRMIVARGGWEGAGQSATPTQSRPGPPTHSQPAILADPVGALNAPWELVAIPLVLTAAGHGKGDIPAALAREQARHPGLSYRYGRPLGPHPALQNILEARIDAALDGAPRRGTLVVLVGRGATDPDGNAEVAKVARLLWEGRGYDEVEFSFVSLAEPSVPAALERARKLGARRIVVAPYFLFPGVLPDRIVAQSRQFAAAHPELDLRTADLIGDCDELADLVLERYEEALRGDIRMNCDTCAYRIALPGFADKVGRPRTPHFHPADVPDHDHVSFGGFRRGHSWQAHEHVPTEPRQFLNPAHEHIHAGMTRPNEEVQR
ncbi:MAG TPA: sirohydrochlorin chelatase [Streptosporangiaceae bacterium]